ncbi:hypothetical protein [Streptomyces sp. NPDC048269]|uniref:hypothetical protein n=1 Tax=Streptomyces sp. NPDC048269 TaxID=3155753 RepID=UPI00342821D6
MALASSMLTAMVSLAILFGAVLADIGGQDVADRIIDRYGLTGAGADAVRDVFSSTADTSVGVLGALFLLISMLSFARAVQRLFEQTWQLKPLSMRNTVNDAKWVLAFVIYVPVSGWLFAVAGRGHLTLAVNLLEASLSGLFLVWGGWILSAKRIAWSDLLPFGVIVSVLMALYGVGADFYLPRLFNSYADRYGAMGVVFAMLSAFFGIVLVVVGSAALGREVRDELGRIRQGERPPDDEVRREWDSVVSQMRERWHTTRGRISSFRPSSKPSEELSDELSEEPSEEPSDESSDAPSEKPEQP